MTDQSGAFPEARTAWDSLIDVVTAYVNDRPVPGGDSDRAVVLAAIERARAALERPRPAPPPRTADEYLRTMQWPDDDVSQQVKYGVETHVRYFARWQNFQVDGGSAGTGAAPPDSELLLLEMNLARLTDELNRIPELRREDELQLAKASLDMVRGWRGWRGSHVVRGGAAQPPPSAPDPEVIREALDCEFRRTGIHHPLEILHRVACCAADALQRVANPDLVRASGVPREETKP